MPRKGHNQDKHVKSAANSDMFITKQMSAMAAVAELQNHSMLQHGMVTTLVHQYQQTLVPG